jgi:diacylglycerol kinase (ATP)
VEESEERAEEEGATEGQSNISTSSLLFKATEKLSFEYNKTTVEGLTKSTHEQLRVDSYMYNLEQREKEDNLFAFRPIEVYERNLLRNMQQQQQQQSQSDSNDMSPFSTSKTDEITVISNSLQIPSLGLPTFENPPPNIYLSDNMTIIDTDQQVSQSILSLLITLFYCCVFIAQTAAREIVVR